MKRGEKAFVALLMAVAVMLACAAPAAPAAGTDETDTLATQSARMNSTASRDSATMSSTIGAEFAGFAGSSANADALVTGLRNGAAITLTSTDAKGVTTPTTFTPPTGKMGFGNVFISLALARQQLAGLGITDPTAQQIQAALAGGSVTGANGQTTTLAGVLSLRAQGMGWGQIAHTLGFKLGPVVSGMKSANAHVEAQSVAGSSAAAPTAAGAGQESTSARGIVTAAGASAFAGRGNAFGRGIVTANGATGQAGHAAGHGRFAGKGN